MKLFNITIGILIPVITAIILIIFIYKWYLNSVIKLAPPKKGANIFYLNLKTRKIKKVNIKLKFISFFSEKLFLDWAPLNNLISKISDKEILEKKLRNVFNNLEHGSTYEKISFIHKGNSKKRVTMFNAEFHAIDDSSNYLMELKWLTKKLVKLNQKKYEATPKQVVIETDANIKLFFAFNINKQIDKAEERFVKLVHSLPNTKEFKFFITNGLMIFYTYERNKRNAKRRAYEFINLFNKRGYSIGGGFLFKGSSYAYSSKITTNKTLNKMVQTLDYLIVESIKKRKPFMSYINSIHQKEFNNFVEASKTFRQSIKSNDIIFETKTVKFYSTNRKILDYINPSIKAINSKMLSKVLNNENNKQMLMDETSKLIGIKRLINKPVLLNVSDSWLIENYKELKYKKAIYVINYNQNKPSVILRKIVKELKEKGFIFSLKIYKYNEDTLTMMKVIEPQSLVISSEIRKNKKLFDSQTTINLMTINKICEKQNIKMIYQSPPKLIDQKISKKIGLKFYFD